MVLVRTSVLIIESAPKNGCHQCLRPQGELQFPLTSLGGPLRSASGSDSGSFQITASAPCLGVFEILCAPFKSRVFISPCPLAPPKVSSSGLQIQIF